MIAPLTIYQANLSNQDFSYLFTFHKLFYMNHIYTCERRNCAKLSSDRLSSDESFAFPSSGDCCYVSYLNFMPQCCSVSPFETHSSYGAIVLDHLAAHRAGLAAGQVTVVTVLQVHADLRGGLHLELIHSGLGLGDIQLVAVLGRHSCVLLSCCGANALVGYRNGSFAARQRDMHEKQWQMLDAARKKDRQTGVFMVY